MENVITVTKSVLYCNQLRVMLEPNAFACDSMRKSGAEKLSKPIEVRMIIVTSAVESCGCGFGSLGIFVFVFLFLKRFIRFCFLVGGSGLLSSVEGAIGCSCFEREANGRASAVVRTLSIVWGSVETLYNVCERALLV